jgi:hypothetical protein
LTGYADSFKDDDGTLHLNVIMRSEYIKFISLLFYLIDYVTSNVYLVDERLWSLWQCCKLPPPVCKLSSQPIYKKK